MNDTVRAAADKHNSTSAAAKAFLHVGSSSARCNVAICHAFGVRHASTFKVITLFLPSTCGQGPRHCDAPLASRGGGNFAGRRST